MFISEPVSCLFSFLDPTKTKEEGVGKTFFVVLPSFFADISVTKLENILFLICPVPFFCLPFSPKKQVPGTGKRIIVLFFEPLFLLIMLDPKQT